MKIGPTFGSSRLFKSFLHLKRDRSSTEEKAPRRKPCGCSYEHKRKSPRLSPEALRCRTPRSLRHSDNLNLNTVTRFHAQITFSIDANLEYRKGAVALAISSRCGLTNSTIIPVTTGLSCEPDRGVRSSSRVVGPQTIETKFKCLSRLCKECACHSNSNP